MTSHESESPLANISRMFLVEFLGSNGYVPFVADDWRVSVSYFRPLT